MTDKLQKSILELIKMQQEQARIQQEALMKSQQEFLTHLAATFNSAPTKNVSDEFRMETLGNAINEFHYDPETGTTFDHWFKRYES